VHEAETYSSCTADQRDARVVVAILTVLPVAYSLQAAT